MHGYDFIKRTIDTPYPSERNSYAMASFNNGVIMAGGIRASGDPHETWFFHCQEQSSRNYKVDILQKLKENCQWYQIVQNDRDTPHGQIHYQNLASLASNNVLVFDWKDPKRSCTWIFKKTAETNVVMSKSGQWECVGDNTNMPKIQSSVFVGGNDMTAILYGRSTQSYSLDTFVYNEDEPNRSSWIVGRVSNLPINKRTRSASCSVIMPNGKKFIAIIGGELATRNVVGDTWFYSQGCPAGYEKKNNKRYCAVCDTGFFRDNNRDDTQICSQCPPRVTTKGLGSIESESCDKPRHDACSGRETTMYYDNANGAVVCKCNFWSYGQSCEEIGLYGISWVYLVIISAMLMLICI